MEPALRRNYTLAEYQQLEQETGIRYEYHNGEVFAMAGGSPEHSAIATNVSDLLRDALPTGCRRFNSDLKIYVPSVDKGFHPDLTVACRPIQRSADMNAIINPMLLIEVLFESTANYDRGQKFWYFAQLTSLREYVLVEQERWAVETRYRDSADSHWMMNFYEGSEAEVYLRSLDLRLSMHQIYEDIEGL